VKNRARSLTRTLDV